MMNNLSRHIVLSSKSEGKKTVDGTIVRLYEQRALHLTEGEDGKEALVVKLLASW